MIDFEKWLEVLKNKTLTDELIKEILEKVEDIHEDAYGEGYGDAKHEIINHIKTPRNSSSDMIIYWLSWLVYWETEYIKKNNIGQYKDIKIIYFNQNQYFIFYMESITN
jgi:hypothetical protein